MVRGSFHFRSPFGSGSTVGVRAAGRAAGGYALLPGRCWPVPARLISRPDRGAPNWTGCPLAGVPWPGRVPPKTGAGRPRT